MIIKAAVSPGKKLTPMVAIFIQGALFNAPFFVCGTSFFSRVLGAFLASLWGVFQPLATLWIVFGGDAFDAWAKALSFLALDPSSTLLLIVAVKTGLAIATAVTISLLNLDYLTSLRGRLKSIGLTEASPEGASLESSLFRRMGKRVFKWPMMTTLLIVPVVIAANKPDAFVEGTLYFIARSFAGLLLLEVLPWGRLFLWLHRKYLENLFCRGLDTKF
ncbi:putative membrane protein [Estrella lausannensis]|uniref:Putative membrane protein n=2 Tax=Estrella lausannensis TaxID=483423 RepID=A0A0H5DRI5_9BACT|nr:putative membrane protein [Estrella lausannensis]